MDAEQFLKQLDVHDPVYDSSEDYEYTEAQLIDFAERYHNYKLSEVAPKQEQIIEVHGEALNLNEIVSIYDIERDKNMFLNRQAGFIVILKDGTKKEFYERIPYESYPHEISAKKRKWFDLQTEISDQWKKL